MLTNVKRCDITIVRKAFHTKSGVDFIYSRWNDPVTEGLHTFYVEKDGDYLAYNDERLNATKMDAYLGGRSKAAFICGYIIR